MSTNKKKSHSHRSQFIRSLAVCSAVLGLGAGYVANPIQAKSSPIKVRTNRQMKKGVTVRTTGKNAVYNKAGVLNSAKVVVNKKRTGVMGKSKRSGNYFRAYRVAKLSNGAVYYKVVSFDGKYRGWIYGGRSINKINGGLKSVNTTKAVKAPNKNNVYQFKAGQSVWKHPERSVYKNGKVLGSTTKYTKHELKVTKAVRLTREGTLYYYVKNQTQPKLSGWVKASGLKLVSRGNAEADKAPDVIETLLNLPGTDGNDSSGGNNSTSNESGGGDGSIVTPESELPGTTDPIKPGEPHESGDNTGEETPDPGDNSAKTEPDEESEFAEYKIPIYYVIKGDFGYQAFSLKGIFTTTGDEDEHWVPNAWLANLIKERFSNEDPSRFRVTDSSGTIVRGKDMLDKQSILSISLEKEAEYIWSEIDELYYKQFRSIADNSNAKEYTISADGMDSGNKILLTFSMSSFGRGSSDKSKILTGAEWAKFNDYAEAVIYYNLSILYAND